MQKIMMNISLISLMVSIIFLSNESFVYLFFINMKEKIM